MKGGRKRERGSEREIERVIESGALARDGRRESPLQIDKLD